MKPGVKQASKQAGPLASIKQVNFGVKPNKQASKLVPLLVLCKCTLALNQASKQADPLASIKQVNFDINPDKQASGKQASKLVPLTVARK